MNARARALSALLTLVLALISISPAAAGTTGGLRGRVVDAVSGAGVAGAKVTVASPSETTSAQTDANGGFSFISLSPDTYLVSVEKAGFDAISIGGVTVQADQVQTTAPFVFQKTLRQIGSVRARTSTDLVRPGTTSDVYSVNAAGQAAAAAVGGPGSLNQAYSAIATVPGANLPQGQQGWNQLVYIRGGDYSDVANELDGVPVQRASDFAPSTTLSSLGQQEVQVYTGGTPPSAEASGLSGFINQVIKTGTYPSYQSLSLGTGAAPFYHKLTFEAGGATKNRNFSYYVGFSGVNQDYRYADNFNGGGPSLFFAPLNVTSNNGTVYDGSAPAYFSPGQSYSIANTQDRENVVNFHFGIPHKSGIKDDIQLLYVNSEIFGQFYSSLNDLGGPALVAQAYGGPATFVDENVYNGALMGAPNPSKLGIAYSPSTPDHTAFTGLIPSDMRDGDSHGVSILKLQYQKNFSANSYLRLFGYSEYNNWFLSGPVSAFLTYSGELQDYEVHGNTFGTTAVYANQIDPKNLLTATASYQTQKLETYNGDTFGVITTNLTDKSGNCYSPSSGAYASCFQSIYNGDGTINPQGGLNQYGQYGFPISGYPSQSLVPALTPPPGSPAVKNGAQWIVTEDGREAQIDEITPFFSAVSLADQFRPTEKLNLNVGARVENFNYRLDDTVGGYPARPFWFQAYDREFCFAPGSTDVTEAGVNPSTGASLCAPGTNANLVNASPRTVTFTAFEPRLSFTYGFNADTVVRGSYGRYAAPAPTSYQQYNVQQQNLPDFIGQFLPYGFNTPFHQSRPSYSNNYDLSLERHLPHTDVAFLSLDPGPVGQHSDRLAGRLGRPQRRAATQLRRRVPNPQERFRSRRHRRTLELHVHAQPRHIRELRHGQFQRDRQPERLHQELQRLYLGLRAGEEFRLVRLDRQRRAGRTLLHDLGRGRYDLRAWRRRQPVLQRRTPAAARSHGRIHAVRYSSRALLRSQRLRDAARRDARVELPAPQTRDHAQPDLQRRAIVRLAANVPRLRSDELWCRRRPDQQSRHDQLFELSVHPGCVHGQIRLVRFADPALARDRESAVDVRHEPQRQVHRVDDRLDRPLLPARLRLGQHLDVRLFAVGLEQARAGRQLRNGAEPDSRATRLSVR